MLESVSYFGVMSGAAIYNLLVLTWQDYKNGRKIDDRKNWFMLGIAVFFIVLNYKNMWWLIGAILGSTQLNIALASLLKLGEGDINALNWINISTLHISGYALMLFYAYFAAANVLYLAYLKVFNKKQPQPYFIVLTISYVATTITLYLM